MQRRFVARETKIMWKICQVWQKCVYWRWFNILGLFLRESKFFTFHVNLKAYWQPLLISQTAKRYKYMTKIHDKLFCYIYHVLRKFRQVKPGEL